MTEEHIDIINRYREIADKLIDHDKVKNNSVLYNKVVHMINSLNNIESQYIKIKESEEQLIARLKNLEVNIKNMLMSKEFKDIDIGL